MRGVLHYMQRTALQGSPTTLMHVTNEYTPGAERTIDRVHPFRKYFDELEVGDTLITARRTVTEADIVNFAGISGDFFYAHMDDIAARDSIFEKRVAHGYFVLSAAAGLFVDPAPGPVLANYGLESLRFVKPVYPGDTIQATLTVKQKTAKENREGPAAAGRRRVGRRGEESERRAGGGVHDSHARSPSRRSEAAKKSSALNLARDPSRRSVDRS